MEAIPSRPYRFTFDPQQLGPGKIDEGNSFRVQLVHFDSPTYRARNYSWRQFLPGPTGSILILNMWGQKGLMKVIPSRPYWFSFCPQPVRTGMIDRGNSFQALQVHFCSPPYRFRKD
jgi:hypothetical protein